VTLRLFLRRLFAQDIAMVLGSSFDASALIIDGEPGRHGLCDGGT
jgi:hypothetical protein